MNLILTIGIFIAFFQFVLLLNKKKKSMADKILGYWMLVIAFHLLSYYLHIGGYWITYPHLIGLTVPFPLFYGPLLYLYISYSIKEDKKLRRKDYLHFIPVLVSYLYMSRFYFFYSVEEKRLVDSRQIDDFDIFTNFLLLAFILSGIGYTILSFRYLKRHKQLLETNFSNTDNIHLNWIKSFIYVIGIIFLTATLIIVTRDLLGINYPFNADFIFYSMLIFSIIALGYFGIRQKNIFADNTIVEQDNNTAKSEYKKSGLKEDIANDIYKRLLQAMKEQKPFLEPKLTLSNLAKTLEISPNHLSQIINQYEKQNFNDFVNRYRIEEFIQRASTNNQYSFLALALDSGFNSKSTFNSVFKKQKGITPSKFMAIFTATL